MSIAFSYEQKHMYTVVHYESKSRNASKKLTMSFWPIKGQGCLVLIRTNDLKKKVSFQVIGPKNGPNFRAFNDILALLKHTLLHVQPPVVKEEKLNQLLVLDQLIVLKITVNGYSECLHNVDTRRSSRLVRLLFFIAVGNTTANVNRRL